MKRFTVVLLCLVFMTFMVKINEVFSQSMSDSECFYVKSLHYDTHGMAYWYSKKQNGLEKLTKVPFNKMICTHCHAKTCDKCHKTKKDGKLAYSVNVAKDMKHNCLRCHAREKAILSMMKKTGVSDVHFSKGMDCVSCHKGMDIHGDGKKYLSMREPGAIKVKCESCHKKISKTTSHIIHNGKLGCTACHVSQTISCANCHMDAFIKEKKKLFIPLAGWNFLINYKGKVVSADIQTFVVKGNKTFMVVAPFFSHYVVKKGKKCEDCHGTNIVKTIQKNNKLTITWIKNGKLENLKGIIPIVKGVTYKNAYMDYKNGKWVPMKNPAKPLIQFAGFGKPLTKEQLNKLAVPFKSKNVK